MDSKVKVFRKEGAFIPTYETLNASGCDLYSNEDCVLKAGKSIMVGTGLHMEIPVGFELQVRPRSGHAAKSTVSVLNTPGTIDADYRGEIKVILINHSDSDFEIKKGMRIAQGVFARTYQGNFEDVSSIEELSSTDRGAGGFGHTGK